MNMSNSPLVDYTLISPHKTSPRVYPITKITIHHMAGNLTVEQCGKLFQSRQAASNYGIDNYGRVGMYVEEKDRAWCSANYDNDHRAINIECANDGGEPDWHVSDVVLNKLIDLCVDVCKRNGIEKLIFTGDKTGNLTQHNYFCSTACPGPYLKSKFPWIAEEVNKRLVTTETMYKLKIGYASGGDITTFKRLLDNLGVSYNESGGYITTDWVTSYQKLKIEAKARELVVPCLTVAIKNSTASEPTPPEDPTPPEEGDPQDPLEDMLAQALQELKETQDTLKELKNKLAEIVKNLQDLI